MTDLADLLDTTAAAQYLGCTAAALRKAMQRGNLVPSGYVGRTPIWVRDDLEMYRNTKRAAGRPRKENNIL